MFAFVQDTKNNMFSNLDSVSSDSENEEDREIVVGNSKFVCTEVATDEMKYGNFLYAHNLLQDFMNSFENSEKFKNGRYATEGLTEDEIKICEVFSSIKTIEEMIYQSENRIMVPKNTDSLLTQDALMRTTISYEEGIIGEAKLKLYESMKRFVEKADVTKPMGIVHSNSFQRYSDLKTIETIVNHTEGSYSGVMYSLSSMYLGKDSYGRSKRVYIAAAAGYGSCGYCDGVINDYENMERIEYYVEEIKTYVEKHCDRHSREVFDIIFDAINTFKRDTLRENALNAFRSLKFFKTFGDAKRSLISQCDERIEFPTFEERSKKFDKVAPKMNLKNFPKLS